MSDRRDTAYARRWWKSLDTNHMTAVVVLIDDTNDFEKEGVAEEDVTVAVKFEVCPTCCGKGTFVNPDIDRHGLSREDFDNDPEFEEDYRRGRYNVQCTHCEGARVVPVAVDKTMRERIQTQLRERLRSEREYANEQAMGY
jgi:hypothetical protein